MAYTTPPTAVASTTATAADFNVLGNDIAYLYGVSQGTTFSAVQVRRAANQSISDSTYTEISFDTENLDVGSWWSSGTDVIVPAGAIPAGSTSIGLLVLCNVKFTANSTGRRWLRVLLNGTGFGSWNISAQNGDTTDIAFTEVTTAEAADVITMEVKQSSGGALDVTEARLTVLRVGVAS